MLVKDKLQLIQERINQACAKAGRNPDEIKIIAVTKYVSIERAGEALEAGIIHFGENRDTGLLEKWEVLTDKPIWHFIGTLQTRKVKNIIDKVQYIHSLDRISLAEEIQKRAKGPVNCFIQVKTSSEESKHGIAIEEVIPFVKKLKDFPNIKIVGLMTMAPLTDDKEIVRGCFRQLRNLQKEIVHLQLPYAPCEELSMGMSNDFEIAIEEGATMIRIGTALVGE